VPGDHLALQQRIGPDLAEARHPLRRLDVHHPGVVERGDREDARVLDALPHVLVRRVRLHVRVHVGVVQRVAPLVPLDHRERQRRIEDRRERIDEGDIGQDAGEQLRGEVGDRPHEEPAGRAALRDHPVGARVAVLDEVPRAVHEVRERVALVQELAVLIPLAAHLTTAAHVRDGEDHAAVQLRQAGDREARLDRVLVRAVAVQVQCARLAARLAERALPDQRQRELRAVLRRGPHPCLRIVGRLVAAEHGLALAQQQAAGRDLVIEDGAGRDERAVTQADERRRPLRVAARAHRVQRLVEFQLGDRSVRVRQHGHSREAFATVAEHAPIAERRHPEQALPRQVRDDDVAGAAGVGCRHLDELEIEGAVVVEDEQHVLAVDHRVGGVVLDALPARPHHAGLRTEVCCIHEPLLGGDRRAHPDHEVAVAAGEARAEPEPLVGLVEELRVVLDGCAQLVQPDRVGSPGVIDCRVDDEAAVGREGRAGERVGDLVRQLLTGDDVAHAHGVALVAGDVDAVQHPIAVGGDLEAAEREELVPLGFDVAVEQDLLALDGDVRRQLGRGPVIRRGEGGAALDAVLAALDGPPVVPPVPAARGHREVGLERAALDLVEDRVLQPAQMCRASPGVGVLGLQVRDDSRVFLRAEPLVGVLHVVTVVSADDRVARGDGRNGGDGIDGHRPTVVDPPARGRARRWAWCLPPVSDAGAAPRSGCRGRRAAKAGRAG
jgi:hypothetical protein